MRQPTCSTARMRLLCCPRQHTRIRIPMNEHATQSDRTLAADVSPAVAVWWRFFLFTADNERVLT